MLEEKVDQGGPRDDGRQGELEREDVQEEGDGDPEVDVEVPVTHSRLPSLLQGRVKLALIFLIHC